MSRLASGIALYGRTVDWLRPFTDLVDLGIRVYVALAFFRSGLLKIQNWDGSLYLFHNEYHVPLLSPDIAAWLGTFGELFLPPLLALGLGTRFAAFGLTILNIVAVVSFWHVLKENEAALAQHVSWGLLLVVTLGHGAGRLSLDHLLRRRLGLAPSRP